MPASTKSSQLQIRVSPAQKAAIRSAARRAGLGISAYALSRLLSDPSRRFHELARDLSGGVDADSAEARFALAELNSWLAGLSAGEVREAVSSPPPGLSPALANYVAAMVELICARNGVAPPSWVHAVPPLAEPLFGSTLPSLRLYLLTHSPAPFRRRSIFIDSSVGSRV